MSGRGFEITMPWGDAIVSETGEEARRVACVAVFAAASGREDLAEEAYDTLTTTERFALWQMLRFMGARMNRIPEVAP